MATLPTNINSNVKTPTARTAGGISGDAGKNVTPIHKPLNPNNYTSNPTAGMQTKLAGQGLKNTPVKPGNDISPSEMAYRKKMSTPQPAAKPASPAQRTESKLMTQQKGNF